MFLSDEIVYSQDDAAEHMYFIEEGQVSLFVDLSEIVDMSLFLSQYECFNMPITGYSNGSQFGETDLLLSNEQIRAHTAISNCHSSVYSLSKEDYLQIFIHFPSIDQQLFMIAKQKHLYFQQLQQELRLRLMKKQNLDALFNANKGAQWTDYMSLKRKLTKERRPRQHKSNILSSTYLKEQRALQQLNKKQKLERSQVANLTR